jgi:hypothetical protein
MTVLLLCCGMALAGAPGDAPQSGPQPGERLPAFTIHAVTGPRAGNDLCYV